MTISSPLSVVLYIISSPLSVVLYITISSPLSVVLYIISSPLSVVLYITISSPLSVVLYITISSPLSVVLYIISSPLSVVLYIISSPLSRSSKSPALAGELPLYSSFLSYLPLSRFSLASSRYDGNRRGHAHFSGARRCSSGLAREQQLTCDVLTSSRLPTAANENDIVERCPQNVLAPAMTLRIHQESRKLSTNASIKSPVHAS